MIYVKKVRSKALKGTIDVTLGPLTLLLGGNGSGKSRIINAIELACTGRVSDVRGRALVAEAAGLQSLGPASGDEARRAAPTVKIEIAELLGGESKALITVTAEGKAGAFFPDALILRDVEEAVAGNAATLRRFLVRHAVGKLVHEDVIGRLPAAQRALYTDARAAAGTGDDTDDDGLAPGELGTLLAVIAYAGKRARQAQADAKACAGLLAGAPSAPAPDDKALALTRAAVEDATAAFGRVAGVEQARAAYNIAASARAVLLKTLNELCKRHPGIERTSAPPSGAAVPTPFTETFRRNLASLRQHVTDNAGKCLVCGTMVGPDHFAQRLAKVEAKVAESEYHFLRARIAEYNAVTGDAPPEAGDAGLARRLLDEARENERKARDLRTAWASVERARAREGECVAQAERYSALASACDVVLRGLLDAGRARFEERVRALLPPGPDGGVFALELTETRIDFGLLVPGEPLRTALSGAEWTRCIAAMGLACAGEAGTTLGLEGIPASADGRSPKILVLPDRGLDAATLSACMEAWRELPARAGVQVIITGVVEPLRAPPEGWTIVRTGEIPGAPARARASASASPPAPDSADALL